VTAQEIRAQLSEAIRSDRRAAAILKKIAAGRANFSDTMDYSLICGRLTGSQLAEAVLELSEDREELAEALLHDRYEDINARCAEVQTALDDKQGLHLAPQKADFPAERAAKFAHSLLDPTVTDETIKRRARSVSENITVTFHDDFIRENAAFRDRAGLKCYVTRSTSGGCCDWCSNVAGRYLMQEQPEGLFRRHDNCDCTIVYDGQVLRGQSGVNGRRGRRWVEEKPKVEYTPPKRFSHDEAEKLQAGKMPKRLTNGADSGIISSRQYDDILQYDGKSNFTESDYVKAVSVIPENLRNELGNYITRIYIGKDDEPSSYNPEKREIRLNPKTGDKSIVHELGHAFGEMYNLYENPDFLSILSNRLELNNWDNVVPIEHPYKPDEYVYVLLNEKFVDLYQGRIYAKSDEIISDIPIEPKPLREYISVGFNSFFNEPDKLKEKDTKLFDYLEGLINGKTIR